MSKYYAQNIGIRIIEVRKESGYNQLDFANELGVSKSSISLYERGEKNPNTEFLYALSEKFNVDLHWLITGESRPAQKQKATDLLDEGVLHQVIDMSVQANWIKLKTKQTSDYIKEFTETYEFLYWKKHKK